MDGMSVVKTVEGIKIYYSPFFEQYIVLLPKGDGSSQMGRFFTADEAEHSIHQKREEKNPDSKKYWWMNGNE